MLPGRQLLRVPVLARFTRTNSTLQASQPEATAESAKKRWPYKPRRPNISRDRPREWHRPLAFGVLPAYDEALKYIKADSEALKTQEQHLRAALAETKASADPNTEVVQEMEKKLEILQIQSQVNLPEVRWKAKNGMADMSKAVDRHIVEKRWREEGRLDELMERIHQMFVVPDVVPYLRPSLDLRVTYPQARKTSQGHPGKTKHMLVEPGTFLLPEQTAKPPKLYTSVFHTDTRLYTLLMVDPDVPDEANSTFQTYLHWLQPNIPLSATSSSPIADLNGHTEYIPPHPQKGTPYHRYTILLLPQKAPVSVPVLQKDQRDGFSVRDFIEKYQLDLAAGGGAFMWREAWGEAVPNIFKEFFGEFTLKLAGGSEEPRYGRPPKPDLYAEARARNKYFK
ncbi:phosphatidylethanolamine-binding protein [Pisolithus tinctorius]|nr:phosphatidylethanolamine-binding protein [Pisolithus tinctorius]